MAAILLASAARTASGNTQSTPVLLTRYPIIEFVLDVTNADTDAADTLDVTVQTRIAGLWLDVVHFTQVIGTDAAKRFVAKILASEPQTMYDVATALAAGSIRHIMGPEYAVSWTIVDGAPGVGDQSFTFSVSADGKWPEL